MLACTTKWTCLVRREWLRPTTFKVAGNGRGTIQSQIRYSFASACASSRLDHLCSVSRALVKEAKCRQANEPQATERWSAYDCLEECAEDGSDLAKTGEGWQAPGEFVEDWNDVHDTVIFVAYDLPRKSRTWKGNKNLVCFCMTFVKLKEYLHSS